MQIDKKAFNQALESFTLLAKTLKIKFATTLSRNYTFLINSSSHKDRFNKNLSGKFGSVDYSKEKLIAEFSSVFSGMKLSLKFDNSILDNSKAYLQGWGKDLENII